MVPSAAYAAALIGGLFGETQLVDAADDVPSDELLYLVDQTVGILIVPLVVAASRD